MQVFSFAMPEVVKLQCEVYSLMLGGSKLKAIAYYGFCAEIVRRETVKKSLECLFYGDLKLSRQNSKIRAR